MNAFVNNLSKSTNLYRLLSLASAFFYIGFGIVNHHILKFESFAIFEQRIVAALIFISFVIISFYSNNFNKQYNNVLKMCCFVGTAHLYTIGYSCGFVLDHTIGIFATYIVTSIFIDKLRELYIYIAYNFILLIVFLFITPVFYINTHTIVLIHIFLSAGLAFMLGSQLINRDKIDKSQANLMAIYNNSYQAILLLDLDFHVLNFNDKARMFVDILYTKDINVGISFFDFVSSNNHEIYNYHLQRCKEGIELNFEQEFESAKGKKYFFEIRITPIYSSEKKIFAIAIFTLDITEKRDSMRAVISSRNNLKQIFNQSTVSLLIIRMLDNKIITANKAMLTLMELNNERLDNIDSSFFYKNTDDIENVTQEIVKNGLIENYELEVNKYTNKVFWGLLSAKSINYNGEQCLLISINDITERKLIELEVSKAKETAEAALKIKTQFMSVMSHEIRTPMNAVIGATQLLMENEPRKDQLQNLEILKFSSNNLLTIINEILDLSRIESGKIKLEKLPVDLVKLLNDVKTSFEFQAKQKGIALSFNIDKLINLPVLTDAARLIQVLNNLIGNAVKFTSSGTVNVNVELVGSEIDKYSILFKIEDTGVGIPADKLNDVFESFTQASSETYRKFGGTGLGLAITKKILSLMNSEIKVESILGEGSTFYFNLELETLYQNNSFTQNVTDSKPDFTGIKILVVDDNDINVKILTQFLKKWGILFDIAVDGQEAVDKVFKNQYNLILMDMQMPVMDGITASMIIKEKGGEYEKLNIIVLSASFEFEMKKHLNSGVICDYVLKPFVPSELLQKIVKYAF